MYRVGIYVVKPDFPLTATVARRTSFSGSGWLALESRTLLAPILFDIHVGEVDRHVGRSLQVLFYNSYLM